MQGVEKRTLGFTEIDGWSRATEVLDDEEFAVLEAKQSDADDVEFGIKQVGAMDGGGEPGLLNRGEGRRSAAEEIFGDSGEMSTGQGCSPKENGLVGVLVLQRALLCRLPGVRQGSRGERAIPAKGSESSLGSVCVRKGEESLAVDRGRLSVQESSWTDERGDGEETGEGGRAMRHDERCGCRRW